MRLTRAAIRAEAATIHETADASSSHADAQDRVPLGEVSPNASVELDPEVPLKKMPAKKAKGKGTAKKAARGRKGKTVEDEVEPAQEVEEEQQEPPVGDAATDELANGSADGVYRHSVAIDRPLPANHDLQILPKRPRPNHSQRAHHTAPCA
jgi:hypothetical protein